jgi:hypothetical protein
MTRRSEYDEDAVTPVAGDDERVVFVVAAVDGMVLHGAYAHGGHADLHAGVVGAAVFKIHVLDRLPPSIAAAAAAREFGPAVTEVARISVNFSDIADRDRD